MLAYWNDAAAGGRLPTRDIVDPAKLGDLMGWLFVYRVERDPLRFRYVVHSPRIALRMGADFTGRYVDEIPNEEAREAVGRVLTAVLTTGRPHRVQSIRRFMGHDVPTEVVVMPLAGPDGGIDHLLALQVYDTPETKPEVAPAAMEPSANVRGKSPSIRAPLDDGRQIRDIRIRMVYERWRAAIRIGRLPSKEFIDPVTFGDLMGWLFLYRVERDPQRFLYLLYGPKIALRMGVDWTGRYVDEYRNPETREAITILLSTVVSTGRPHHVESSRRLLDREMVTEAVVLPLAGPDGIIDHLLALQILDVPTGGEAG
jgi:hypothetical protein